MTLSLPSWPEMHGALTHFPIALLITACVFEIGAALLHRPAGRLVSFWMLVAAVVMSVPALITGWMTGGEVFAGAPSLPSVFVWHRAAAFTTAGLALILLAWRAAARDRLAGRAMAASVLLILIVAGVVGYTGYLGGKMVFGGQGEPHAAGPQAEGTPGDRQGIPALEATRPAVDPRAVAAGQKLFASNNCTSCHKMNGTGGTMGPDLTHEARRHNDIAWQIEHLKQPGKMHPGSMMPSYAQLKPDDLQALAAYLVTRD